MTPLSRVDAASCVLAVLGLWLILQLHLLAAVIAGLLVYELVLVMSPPLQRHFRAPSSRAIALIALITAVVLALAGIIVGASLFFKSQSGSLPMLLEKLAEAAERLPPWLSQSLPTEAEDMPAAASQWLREHSKELRKLTGNAGRTLAHIIIGMAVGAVLSLHHARRDRAEKPLAAALAERSQKFGDAFRRVMFAQVRISAINTVITALYVAVLLPLFAVQLPFKTTLIAVTFIAGLLPVVGNLISNTIIVLISLTQGVYVAIGSLVFLALIHKLEYFLNARIVGSRVNARAWELLVAMLVLEAAFGLPGLIAAPFYYAYVKSELADRGLV
jgi:predicted PurR-regulated permease PerM